MASATVLKDEYLKFADPANDAFPVTMDDAIQKWADMLQTYAQGIFPASSNLNPAGEAFKSGMAGVNVDAANWMVLFPIALKAFGTALGAGMGIAGYAGAPNPVNVDLTPILPVGMLGAPTSTIAAQMSGLIHAWFKGCTASNSNGTINWQ